MYMSKLLSQGGFGCVFHPGLNCNAQPTNNTAIATKVQSTLIQKMKQR